MKIFIVSSRYGVEMNSPEIFKNRTDAENFIKSSLAEAIDEDFGIDMKKKRINANNIDEVLEYGEDHNFLADYNDTGFSDTYTYGSDWTEYMITEADI